MKFEYTYGQEERFSWLEASEISPLVDYLDSQEAVRYGLRNRARRTWNTATFIGLGSAYSSSVCTSFTLASRTLYSDELSRYAKRLSAFISTVAWSNLETMDRHYFVQVLEGVVRSAFPGAVLGLNLLNHKSFYWGEEFPVLRLNVGRKLAYDWALQSSKRRIV
jgi:hypothetical protein